MVVHFWLLLCFLFFFFFNYSATTEIYTLSLHDALPIRWQASARPPTTPAHPPSPRVRRGRPAGGPRSEEHTSELQSRGHLVCRLLLEKKKTNPRSLPHTLKKKQNHQT